MREKDQQMLLCGEQMKWKKFVIKEVKEDKNDLVGNSQEQHELKQPYRVYGHKQR